MSAQKNKHGTYNIVIPAKAGIHLKYYRFPLFTPAYAGCAGMTVEKIVYSSLLRATVPFRVERSGEGEQMKSSGGRNYYVQNKNVIPNPPQACEES